ncbi:hypothetical protein [uncultured Thiodictyon sp.]|uniref:hypothetical protein n=1 Tax=uncultured Thiodictyon sp. TaxID=1846217 RepID=UPI0025DC450A|nr:hypothetical protein [uncultured Thiodictyon sp.]
MHKSIITCVAIAAVIVSGQAFAGAKGSADGGDDAAWIAKCVKDNAKEGAAAATVEKYCTCMNDKMGDDETKSVSGWEKTHPAEMKACEQEAGWK